jgi:hypothetical protein
VTLVGRQTDRLGEEELEVLRENWSHYTPYRGDTENHWIMYHASMYLISEVYPDEPASFWFNGKSSEENHQEAGEYIEHWFDLVTSIGQIEFDSPHYIAMFVAPLALLYGWAKSEAMRKRAGKILDLTLGGFAAESLNGLYAGAFSRVYPEPLMERWKNASTTLAWLVFGNVPFRPAGVNVVLPRIGYRPHAMAMVLAMSGYEPSSDMVEMATDRSEPYVHIERHRTRTRIRYADTLFDPVYKTSYVTKDFVLGSVQGGLIQPIQQHSWELFWATDDPHEGHNLLFTLHPYASEHELGMFFPEEPELLEEAVIHGEKPTYGSPDKWTGASPYEQIFQHRNSLIVLYDIPEGTRYGHISGFFSAKLEEVTEDESGWIFCRGGRCLIGYRPLARYEWRMEDGGHRRLHSTTGRNGAIVHVAPEHEYGDLSAFAETVRSCELDVSTKNRVYVRFQTPAGDLLEAAFGETPLLDGDPVDYANWALFGGKFGSSLATLAANFPRDGNG